MAGLFARRFGLAAAFWVASAAAATDSIADAAPSELPPLVFIHGIKGARLVDASGRSVWVSASEALGISTPPLALPLAFKDGSQAKDDIRPAGVLDEISIIPGIYSVDVYGSFLNAARASGREFYPFAYDWRRDNRETAAQFAEFLAKVSKDHKGAKVAVVSHSMGGLITLAVMNEHPELFRSVVFAGVPFKGGIGFWRDLHIGESTGFNSEVLGPRVLATFPAVFTLFPDEPREFSNARGTPVRFDFLSAKDWEDHAVGPFSPPAEGAAFKEFFVTALAAATEFRHRLGFPHPETYPPLLIVTSKAHPTLVDAIFNGPKAVAGLDLETAPTAPGDGRVAFTTAQPPAEIKFELEITEADHADLLNDETVQKRVFDFTAK